MTKKGLTVNRNRNEAGYCLPILALGGLLLALLVMCSGATSDCYHTPGAQEGSAQDMRDRDRCIRG